MFVDKRKVPKITENEALHPGVFSSVLLGQTHFENIQIRRNDRIYGVRVRTKVGGRAVVQQDLVARN